MKSVITFVFSCWAILGLAQTDLDLAESYYQKGNFEQALYYYSKLLDRQPNNANYIFKKIEIQQELKQFSSIETFLKHQIEHQKNPQFLVELGYNFQIQNKKEQANSYYNQAIDIATQTPPLAYAIALRFEAHNLVDQAISTYKIALNQSQNLNYEYRLAGLYAEKKDIENMFLSYLRFADFKPAFLSQVLRLLSDYINEDPSAPYNQLLKRIILKQLQNNSSSFWTGMLSWLYLQQKEFNKALIQEKALYRRGAQSLQGVIEVGLLAKSSQDYKSTQEAFDFVLEYAQVSKLKIEAKYQLINLQIETSKLLDLSSVQAQFETLLSDYGINEETLEVVLSYADFLAFYINDKSKANHLISSALKNQFSEFSLAKLKLKRADILVSMRQFNRALVYYTQVHTTLKNSVLAQEARFKAAKTSFYKGDFDWAEAQLKILKSSTSQLIANDALNLQLLITDHKFGDSLQGPLTTYAKADFYHVHRNNNKALTVLDSLISTYPTHAIVDQALLLQAKIFESQEEFEKAKNNYLLIINNYSTEILVDDAYFAVAELYKNQLNAPLKAIEYFEKIVFEHQDSIHFVDAKKSYRNLRQSNHNTKPLPL